MTESAVSGCCNRFVSSVRTYLVRSWMGAEYVVFFFSVFMCYARRDLTCQAYVFVNVLVTTPKT